MMTKRQTLYFARPFQVETYDEALPALQTHQVLVCVALSAISAGTELLFYRGQVPDGMPIDITIDGMQQPVHYPLTYGYCCVGEVGAVGTQVDSQWLGRRVFAFHPHTSAFASEPSALLPIPPDLSYEQALFLPNMETAVNFVMDAQPLIGERVIVIGLGIVGLLTAYLLTQFPLSQLVVTDFYAKRIELAHQLGIRALLSPDAFVTLTHFEPDLIFEVSSNPAALADALHFSAFGTRIVVGSWYGDKLAHLPLGEGFHRNRVQLISSQVSTLDGRFSNRWDKSRRIDVAWQQMRNLPAHKLISHRVPISEAHEAYRLLDKQPDQALQILLTY